MLWWMLLSSFISAVTLAIAIQKREAPKSRYFILLTLSITIYCLGRTFESAGPNLESAYFGVILSYIGLPYIPVFMLLFLLDYNEIKLDKRPWAILWIPLVLTSIFVTVPPLRHLYYASYSYSPGPLISQIVVVGTPYYLAMFGLHALLSIASLSLALRGVIKFSKTERLSSLVIFIAVLLPSLAEVLYVLRKTPLQMEITPIALSIAVTLMCVAVYQLNLLRVLPLAKDTILDQLSDAFFIADPENRFLEANAAAKKIIPALSNLHVGQSFNIATMFPSAEEDLDNRILVTIETSDGPRYYHLSETVVEEHKKKRCICYTLHNVTDTRNMMAELKTMATFDALTGIYNRASFYHLAEQEMERAHNQRTQISALAIDTDHFKEINDTYGHFCGDIILKGIVGRISARLRKADILGRVGGDEFNIMLPNTTPENAATLAKNLQNIISAQPFMYEGKPIHSTISIGVATYMENRHANLKQLLTDVDDALYQSKNAGRNTVCMYQPDG